LGDHHAGELRRESAAAKAGRIIAEDLQRLGWTQFELERRNNSAPEKLVLAARLRRETTWTIRESAARLHLGSLEERQHPIPELGTKGQTTRNPGMVIV